MVTAWPARASSAAAVSPAGPEPTTATRFPVGLATSGRVGVVLLYSRRRTARVRRPYRHLVAEDADPRTVSVGRPRRGGSMFCPERPCGRREIALRNLMDEPRDIDPDRQPFTQSGFLHWRQRSARQRPHQGEPESTSSKSWIRSRPASPMLLSPRRSGTGALRPPSAVFSCAV